MKMVRAVREDRIKQLETIAYVADMHEAQMKKEVLIRDCAHAIAIKLFEFYKIKVEKDTFWGLKLISKIEVIVPETPEGTLFI